MYSLLHPLFSHKNPNRLCKQGSACYYFGIISLMTILIFCYFTLLSINPTQIKKPINLTHYADDEPNYSHTAIGLLILILIFAMIILVVDIIVTILNCLVMPLVEEFHYALQSAKDLDI
jgi:hypothetical protein